MKALTIYLVRSSSAKGIFVGIWAAMVNKGSEASELPWAWVSPPSIMWNQAETMLGFIHTIYFPLCHKVFFKRF